MMSSFVPARTRRSRRDGTSFPAIRRYLRKRTEISTRPTSGAAERRQGWITPSAGGPERIAGALAFSRRADGVHELRNLVLQPAALARQRLRGREHLGGRPSRFRRAALHVRDTRFDLRGSVRGTLHISRDFLGGG